MNPRWEPPPELSAERCCTDSLAIDRHAERALARVKPPPIVVDDDDLRVSSKFISGDVPRCAAAIGTLARSSSKERRQQVERAFVGGGMRMFSTPTGVCRRGIGSRNSSTRRARAARESGGPNFTGEDVAAARALLEVCAELLPRVVLTRGSAVALATLSALEALDRGDGQALERLAQIEGLFFDVFN
jgi:hypothetical protein